MKAVLRVFGRLLGVALVTLSLWGAGGVALVSSATVAEAQTVSGIVVRGNRRIEAATVRAYFRPGPSGRLDSAAIDEGIRTLFATGLFEDVRVSREGGQLVVTVVENVVINRVAFEGNRKIKDAVLEGVVESKARGPLNRATIQSDSQRILEAYRQQGRSDARVEPKIVSLPNGRVDLIYEINEGDRTKIANIDFIGNQAFSDGRLRDELTTTESNWLSWLKTSDVYDPDRLNADMELLRRFYLNNGYADFRVVSSVAQYDASKNAFFVTVTVEEGERYTFGGVDVESAVPDIDAASLRRLMLTRPGSTYSATQVEKTVEAMSLELAKRGYAFAQVRPRGSRDYAARTITVIYSVEEGSRVYVERINVRGNTRTRDYVIRREFELAEGDAYNQALIDRAERRLRNLGFFKTVRITSEPGSTPDRVIVNVDVEDQPTGEFSVAGGYSTTDGFIGEIGVAEKNFLGRGQYVKVSASWGELSEGVEFSFTEPYFLGRRLSAGFDLFYKNRDETEYSSYEIETYGGTLRTGLPLTEELSLGLNYTVFNRDISIPNQYKDNRAGNGEASIALREAEGESLTSQAGYSFVYNSLDNNLNPTSGLRAEFRQDFAGLGGDSEFFRTAGDVRYYYDLPSEFVALLRGQAGHVGSYTDEPLKIFDQFFKGPDLVRGFAPSGIGPRDIATNRRDPVGGTMYYGGSLEVQFPLFGLPKELGLKGAVFADAGTLFGYDGIQQFNLNGRNGIERNERIQVFDSEAIRSSVGVSLLWNSPLGPLRFDYAYVLSKERYDDEQAFRFSGGTRF